MPFLRPSRIRFQAKGLALPSLVSKYSPHAVSSEEKEIVKTAAGSMYAGRFSFILYIFRYEWDIIVGSVHSSRGGYGTFTMTLEECASNVQPSRLSRRLLPSF